MGVDPALPPSLAAELADLKRRLANLERSPQLPYSSSKGLVISGTPLPMDLVLDLQNVTSGTFTDLWEGRQDRPSGGVYVCECRVLIPAGTTGEIRVHDYAASTSVADTSAYALTNADDGFFIRFEWVHPAVTGWNDPLEGVGPPPAKSRYFHPSVQARRTGGAGNVTIFRPYTSYFTSLQFVPTATTGGNPQRVSSL